LANSNNTNSDFDFDIKRGICIICKDNLKKENTMVEENQKYIKYKKKICSSCFKEYYP
jgi:hypothetical protein